MLLLVTAFFSCAIVHVVICFSPRSRFAMRSTEGVESFDRLRMKLNRSRLICKHLYTTSVIIALKIDLLTSQKCGNNFGFPPQHCNPRSTVCKACWALLCWRRPVVRESPYAAAALIISKPRVFENGPRSRTRLNTGLRRCSMKTCLVLARYQSPL